MHATLFEGAMQSDLENEQEILVTVPLADINLIALIGCIFTFPTSWWASFIIYSGSSPTDSKSDSWTSRSGS